MARGTRYGGASLTPEESADPATPQPVRVRRAEIGPMPRLQKEESSPGNSSNLSSQNAARSSNASDPLLRQPAPMTDSLSNPTEQESDDTALTTGTGGRKASKRTAAKVRTVDDEFGDVF